MNEQEKTTMNIIEPEGLSSCGADSGTWCGQALTRVLIGMTLTGLTLNVLCLNYILPAIGMVFLLVGLRALRRENAGFKGGYVIARPASQITFQEIIDALDITVLGDVDAGGADDNSLLKATVQECLWDQMTAYLRKFCAGVTLQDMIERYRSSIPPEESFMYYI